MAHRFGSLLLAALIASTIHAGQAVAARDAAGAGEARAAGIGARAGFPSARRGRGHRRGHRKGAGHRHGHRHSRYGRHHRYGYGYGWGWGGRSSYRAYPATWQVRDEDLGFAYLVSGKLKQAVSVFARQAEADPGNAVPKLGYSIAMSELGELELGVWAMRRAVRTSPEALRGAEIDNRLRPRVAALLDVYHPSDSDSSHGDDAHFMVASLLWVLGDIEGARAAIAAAAADGDEHDSTLALSLALSTP